MTMIGANETAEEASIVASIPLRICCYGSSSSRTPAKYTDQAYNLGKILALRGHTCVNGAGSAGCKCCYCLLYYENLANVYLYYIV